MRILALTVATGLFGMAVGAGAVLLAHRQAAPERDATAISLPPAASPNAVPSPLAPPPAAVPAAGSDLPTVELAPRPLHTVPDQLPPTPTVTLLDQKGRTIRELRPSAADAAPASVAGAAPPNSLGTVSPSAGRQLAMASARASFGGPATAAGATMIAVDGRTVRLFGIKPAESRDRCGLGPNDVRTCAEIAREALAQRLAHYPKVFCRVPGSQRADAGAICLDGNGIDLAGFLVAEGYALADTQASRDYYGAEGVARSTRRGLWHTR